MKLWPLPFSLGILAILSGNLVFFISSNEGFVESCFPYIEGCASISKSGRNGLSAILFKLTILPVMTLLSVYWIISYKTVIKLKPIKSLRNSFMLISGIIGSFFGIIYTAFLGTEGEIYQLLRRYGIYFFFLGTYVAQILEVLELTDIFEPNNINMKAIKFVTYFIGLIIIISTPFYGFLENDDWLENVLEWNITFLIFFYFVLSSFLWKETRLSMKLDLKTLK